MVSTAIHSTYTRWKRRWTCIWNFYRVYWVLWAYEAYFISQNWDRAYIAHQMASCRRELKQLSNKSLYAQIDCKMNKLQICFAFCVEARSGLATSGSCRGAAKPTFGLLQQFRIPSVSLVTWYEVAHYAVLYAPKFRIWSEKRAVVQLTKRSEFPAKWGAIAVFHFSNILERSGQPTKLHTEWH